MRLWKPTLNSLPGLLAGLAPRCPPQGRDDPVEAIQKEMLAVLRGVGGCDQTVLAQRIASAEEAQALWYLRPELMTAVAAARGEGQARETLRNISARFEGLLPRSLSTRPSPLGR